MKNQFLVLSKNTLCFLTIILLYSCSSSAYIKTDTLDIKLSGAGKIVGMWIGKEKTEKDVMSFTEIEGCRLDGKVKIHKSDNGMIEFTRTLRNDSLNTACTVIDRFFPTESSIRWEVEIKGNDSAWSAPIKTIFNYPATRDSRFWTSWSRPKYDSSWDKKLKEALLPVKGSSTDEAILDISNRDWVDPLIPVPFIQDTLFYGAPPPFLYNKSLISAQWTFFRELFAIPLFSVIEEKEKIGINLILSPEDNIINLVMTSSADGSVVYSRLSNRISNQQVVKFSMDLKADLADWRGGLGWMNERYPEYFNPVNSGALQLNGTSTYSNYFGDFDEQKMKAMAFTVNWQASFDFPYMGMFLPPVKSDEEWTRFGAGDISVAIMSEYANRMREKGFYVLNYFNVTEFGARIKYPYTPVKSKTDPGLWKESNEFLYTNLSGAIVQNKTDYFPGTKAGNPIYTWGKAVVMDCADSVYREFLLNQARRHINEIPGSYGICIDRLDWLNYFNESADDGITWFNGKPARSLTTSYKSLMEELGPLMHQAGKYILANSISRRIDYMKHLDGVFDEFAYAGGPLNNAAFVCINKPVLGWTDNSNTILEEGGDNFFQKYLYMGVFPMCPFPGSDHSLQPEDSVDKLYLDYGHLLKLMKERKWVLSPHVVSVKNNDAKANVYSTPAGYLIPVVYGKQDKVQVSLQLPGNPENLKCLVFYPGQNTPTEISYKKEEDKIVVNMDLVRGCAMLLFKTTGS